MIGDGHSRCRRILMTSPRRQCSITRATIRSCAHTCIFCKEQWHTSDFMDCARNGGISPPVTGNATFRNGLRNLATPSSFPQPNESVSPRPPEPTGICSCPHQSSPDLRIGGGLDRIDHCIFSSQPACTNRNVSPCFNQRRFSLAGL